MTCSLHWELKRDKRTSIKSTAKFILAFLYSRGVFVLFRGLLLSLLEKSIANNIELTTVILFRDDLWENQLTVSCINRLAQWTITSFFRYARLVLLFNSGKVDTDPFSKPATNNKKKTVSKTSIPKETYLSSFRVLFKNFPIVLVAGGVYTLEKIVEDALVSYGVALITTIDSYEWETIAKMAFTVLGFTLIHPFQVLQNRLIIGQRFRAIMASETPTLPSKVLSILQTSIGDPISANLSGITIVFGVSTLSISLTAVLNSLMTTTAQQQQYMLQQQQQYLYQQQMAQAAEYQHDM